MAILIGIDEAGYGPLLGPMVVSSAVFELPEEYLRADLWKVLKTAVAPNKKRLSGRVLITDSKKAYSPATGISHLRKSVLSCLYAAQTTVAHDAISSAHDLLFCLDSSAMQRVEAYDWYRNLRSQPLGHQTAEISLSAAALRNCLAASNIRLLSLQSRCLDVAYFNARVDQVRNKSRVLFTELCTLILNAVAKHPSSAQPLQIIVDRQGGRINYHQELLRMFPGASLAVLRQDETMSSYELEYDCKRMRIHFCVKADSRYLPVCLASMASKYLREVLMEAQNGYFCSLCPELKPTAGYWQDGQRFIDELTQKIPTYPINKFRLIRSL